MADDTIGDGGNGDDAASPIGVSGTVSNPTLVILPDHDSVKFPGVFTYTRMGAVGAPANDNAIVEAPGASESGFEPGILGLSGGDTLLTWVGLDGHAHGHLCGPVRDDDDDSWISPPEYAAVNAGLSDLGPVGPPLDGDRRIQAVEPRPGTFAIMWLALAESGLAARGKIFLPTGVDRNPSSGDAPWTDRPIEDVALPGFARGFRVAGAGTDQLLVSYETAKTTQGIVVSTARAVQETPHDGADATLGHANGEGPHRLEASTSLADLHVHQELAPNTPKGAVAVKIADEAATNEFAPIVTALGDGFVVAWQTPGNSDGITQFKLTLYDEHGVARTLPDGGTVLVVSDNVAADTPPAISEFGNGIAVAYKNGDDGKLVVKAYGANYAPVGEETVVDAGMTGAIYDIAAASIEVEEGGGSHDQLALAYTVEDDDPSLGVGGYHFGNIYFQRLGVVTEGGEPHVVSLGRDGNPDGNNDPAPLTMETPDGPSAVVGRSPSLAGLDNGDLAIVWVESDGTRETIRGEVLEQDGDQVLRLDLTSLIEYQGIVRGTTPDLFDAGGGDILVSWLQHDGDYGDYVVMAALYDSVSHGVWIEPDEPIRLKSFDEMPDDYSVALSHADGLSILVTWDEDSSGKGSGGITTQRYDISGEKLGEPLSVTKRTALTQDDQLATSSLAAAGLTEGQIVVVYAEQGSRRDTDLAAHIVDVTELIGSPSVASTELSPSTPDTGGAAEATQYSTEVDQEIAIDPLSGAGPGLNIARVNGEPIDATTPIDVGAAWVQLRDDGWLTVCPDSGYEGPINFEYTVASPNGGETVSNVTVSVATAATPADATAFNQLTSLAEGAIPANLSMGNLADDSHLGTEALSIAGLDASLFTIVGSTLYLKGGVELDFDTAQSLTNKPLAASEPGALTYAVAGGSNEAEIGGVELTATQDDENDSDGEPDISFSGYATFRRLMDAGALAQVGDDVVITLDLGDPDAPHTVTLRGVSLSSLTDAEFKF